MADDDIIGMQNPLFKIMNACRTKKEDSPMNEDSSINEDSVMNSVAPINSRNEINVTFEYNKDHFSFLSHKDEFLSSLFYKFRDKINDFETDFNFVGRNTRINNLYDPKKKLGEVNIDNFPRFNITVYKKNDLIGGGFSLNFTDLSKQIYEEHYFSDKAPSYRVICKGINIYGICKLDKCKAYNKEVIDPLKKKKEFDLINEKDCLKCPECKALISPKTVGFHLCEYKIKGTKFENGKGIPFEFNGKADNKDSVQYYNPDKNGTTIIVELKIEITKYL